MKKSDLCCWYHVAVVENAEAAVAPRRMTWKTPRTRPEAAGVTAVDREGRGSWTRILGDIG